MRGYGGPPRPPIGKERRDREQYRHEGTNNYPPTIATTIRTRPPPPSATTLRFGVRDKERGTNGIARTRTTRCRDTRDGKGDVAEANYVREGKRWKNLRVDHESVIASLFFFFLPTSVLFFLDTISSYFRERCNFSQESLSTFSNFALHEFLHFRVFIVMRNIYFLYSILCIYTSPIIHAFTRN